MPVDAETLGSWLEEARRCHKGGDLAAAKPLYLRILEEVPRQPTAQNLLGVLLESEGDHERALQLLRDAVRQRPRAASFRNNLGNSLRSLGRIAEAEAAYREALRLRPAYSGALYNLAVILRATGRSEEAVASLEHALELAPDLAEARLALADSQADRGRWSEAETTYRTALAAPGDHPEAWFGLGNLLRQQERIGEAIACFQRCVRARPDRADAYNNLGSLFQMQGRVSEAIACIRRSLELDPDSASAHFNLATLFEGEGRLEEALAAYEQSLAHGAAFAPQVHLHIAHVKRLLCDWSDADGELSALQRQIETHLRSNTSRGLPPLTLNLFAVPSPMRLAVARQQANGIDRIAAQARERCAFVHPRGEPGRLKIGYVSPDFRGHAVGTLVHRMFELHDRERFEVYAYSLVNVDDDFSRAIRAGVDHFADCSGESPEQSARRIHADGIHVAIDLAGYTTYSRTGIFALRPAPVQVHYLGYLDTMGAKFLPWLIADETVVTDEMAALYSEAIVRLPDCFMVASPLPISDAAMQRAEHGLPDDAFVFCCMNSLHKVDPGAFAVWMRILERVPGSVLWLFESTTATGVANLRRAAAEHGVAPERLHFASRLPLAEYLARYRLADLFLDSFAYNAGATAIGALQAGLPVLTHPGSTQFARMGASICRAAGLPELVCKTPEAYEELAVALAGDPERLGALRARLREGQSTAPLFDTERSVRQLEKAYRAMWQQHQAGSPPGPLRV